MSRTTGKKIGAVAVALLALAIPGPGVPAEPEIPLVEFDPRVELFSILWHLAGAEEYLGKDPAYAAATDKHFKEFRRHPAVKTAARLRKDMGIGYFHPMNLAVHLTPPPDLAERTPFDGTGHSLGRKWPPKETRAFLEQVRAFYREARVREFFESQAAVHAIAVSRLRDLAAQEIDVAWFEQYFGGRSSTAFFIAPALLNGGAQYAATYADGRGTREAHAIIGIHKLDASGSPRFDEADGLNIVHEFAHTLTNPGVSEHLSELETAGPQLFEPVKSKMREQRYGEWQTMIYEAVVRAVVIRFVAAHRGQEAAVRVLEEEKASGFSMMPALTAALEEYERSRERFPKFGDFMPRIMTVLQESAPPGGQAG